MAKLRLIWLLLSIATQNRWPINMFDFHSAFLNDELDSNKEVFMEQPEGYEELDQKQYICKLFKSLYRLKQVGRKWYDALCQALAEIGFKWSGADPAVFYTWKGNDTAVLVCHVDNCTITGSSQQLIQDYKNSLKAKYSLKDLGPANWLLGIKITRDLEAQTISLSQSMYIDSILVCFNFTDLKSYAIPMDPSICFSRDQCPQTAEEVAEMCRIPYWEAVGSLNYCTIATWPDIAFLIPLLAQFMDNPWSHSLGSHQVSLLLSLRYQRLEIDICNHRWLPKRIYRHRWLITGALTHYIEICVPHEQRHYLLVIKETRMLMRSACA